MAHGGAAMLLSGGAVGFGFFPLGLGYERGLRGDRSLAVGLISQVPEFEILIAHAELRRRFVPEGRALQFAALGGAGLAWSDWMFYAFGSHVGGLASYPLGERVRAYGGLKLNSTIAPWTFSRPGPFCGYDGSYEPCMRDLWALNSAAPFGLTMDVSPARIGIELLPAFLLLADGNFGQETFWCFGASLWACYTF